MWLLLLRLLRWLLLLLLLLLFSFALLLELKEGEGGGGGGGGYDDSRGRGGQMRAAMREMLMQKEMFAESVNSRLRLRPLEISRQMTGEISSQNFLSFARS